MHTVCLILLKHSGAAEERALLSVFHLPMCKVLNLAWHLWLSTKSSFFPDWAFCPGCDVCLCSQTFSSGPSSSCCLSELSPSHPHRHCLHLTFLILWDNGSGPSAVIGSPEVRILQSWDSLLWRNHVQNAVFIILQWPSCWWSQHWSGGWSVCVEF